jgi:hypothetical protein
MEKVDFKFNRNGSTRIMPKRQAEILQKLGHGQYQTRDMAFQPLVTKPMQAAPAETAPTEQCDVSYSQTLRYDGLDVLDKEQLHALAKERGVKVHHMAGADRVRAALREQA